MNFSGSLHLKENTSPLELLDAEAANLWIPAEK